MEQSMEWDLSNLYKGYDDPKYESDLKKIYELVDNAPKMMKSLDKNNLKDSVEAYLKYDEEINVLSGGLFSFSSLQLSTNVNDTKSQSEIAKLQIKFQELVPLNVAFSKFIKNVNLDELCSKSKYLDEYKFYLENIQKSAKHMLSDKEEMLYAKLQMVASDSWGDLQSKLTSNIKIKVEGIDDELPLSSVRNLAYDNNPEIRKNAYEAELKAYKQIDEAVAMGLNNIKREANIMANMRGYKSILDMSVKQSNMTKKTLDAMISAIKQELPKFRKYYKLKAKALGYKKGLPFYEIFAPMGKLTKTYTYNEAKEEVLSVYKSFSDSLYNMGKRAFEENWIDVLPHEGKVGGAFCSNQQQIKESRVLTNFTGQLSDIQTLAHELGHAYHGHVISENKPLNWGYPMPLAETASILCQTMMSKKLIAEFSDPFEKLTVVENSLQEDTQCVVDILSRFLFENKVCNTPIDTPLSSNDMCNLMIEAQKESYGNGLDQDNLHPYMWLCKSHYYNASYNFYNWPYAFGLLYGRGLYALYQINKEEFVKNYDQMLRNTGMMSVEAVAKGMNIDVTKKEFWLLSLKSIEEDIDLFEDLLKKTNENFK